MARPPDPVDFAHPDNARALEGLARLERLPSYVQSAPRGRVDDWQLGTHPDLVSLLWGDIDQALPVRCAWIVHGRPALVHPGTGRLFAFAFGTQRIVLRVPGARHAELGLGEPDRLCVWRPAGGSDFSACEPDWVFAPYGPPLAVMARAAFDAAGRRRSSPG